jgi:hypothetical protein
LKDIVCLKRRRLNIALLPELRWEERDNADQALVADTITAGRAAT